MSPLDIEYACQKSYTSSIERKRLAIVTNSLCWAAVGCARYQSCPYQSDEAIKVEKERESVSLCDTIGDTEVRYSNGDKKMEEMVSFGEWVRRRRKALDLTQAGLAEQVGVATITIRKIERDERRPSPQIAELLAEHLQVPGATYESFMQMSHGQYVSKMISP